MSRQEPRTIEPEDVADYVINNDYLWEIWNEALENGLEQNGLPVWKDEKKIERSEEFERANEAALLEIASWVKPKPDLQADAEESAPAV